MSECGHPIDSIEVEDGQTICSKCGLNLDAPENTDPDGVVVAGALDDEDPRTDPGLGLKHITWAPDRTYAARPYTPEEVELEIIGTIDLIDRGTSWLVAADQQRYEAKMAYDLGYARKLLEAPGRSAEQRAAWTTIQTEDLYRDWQRLEIIHKTRERAMHNLRAKLSGLQSVAKNLTASLGVGGGFR